MSTQTAIRPDATLNGLDIRAMGQVIGAVNADRALAQFQFRASNKWLGGTMNLSSVQGFFGAGAEDKSRSGPFKLVSGEPPLLLGNNEGANPGEHLLHALAACVTTTTIMHATARGIRVESMSSEIYGDVDLRGALDLDESVPAAFSRIRIKVDIKADCTDAQLDELLQLVRSRSAVVDTVTRPVTVLLERA